MARWKLVVSHYLNCPDTEWEYNETDRITGRPKRTRFSVPRYLDINDPGCWTNSWGNKDNADGEVIVCHEGKGEPRDQIFFGDPTPDMIPVDDEARAISATFEQHWSYKPDTAEISYSQSLVDDLQAKRAEMEARPQQVEIAGLGDLVASIAAMAKQNQDLIASLSHRKL